MLALRTATILSPAKGAPLGMDKSIKELEADLHYVKEKQAKIIKQIKIKKKQDATKSIACVYCNKRHALKTLIFIRQMCYVEPYGCNEGDYWLESEGGYLCPDCMKLNRFIFDREWLSNRASQFAVTVRLHERSGFRSLYSHRAIVDRADWGAFSSNWFTLYGKSIDHLKDDLTTRL
jgi:hypothetical protein